MTKAHELAKGDAIDVYTDKEKLEEARVLKVLSGTTFVIASNHEPVKVFVYGKWVDNVHMVDYDAISMLNVSATQHLYHLFKDQQKKLEQHSRQSEQLKKIIAQLQEKIEGITNGVMH